MWHKQSFTQFWSQSDAYSRRSSLKLTYIHHPLVVCTHQICCAVAVPIALSQDRLLHGHNRLVNWTPCSRMREQAKNYPIIKKFNCHQSSNISHTIWGNKIGDHSDVGGASPVGAAPTTSSFSTKHMTSADWAKITARRDDKYNY